MRAKLLRSTAYYKARRALEQINSLRIDNRLDRIDRPWLQTGICHLMYGAAYASGSISWVGTGLIARGFNRRQPKLPAAYAGIDNL